MKYGALICGTIRVWVVVCLSWALLFPSCVDCPSGMGTDGQSTVADAEVNRIVNNINLIAGLSVKRGEPQWDEHAALIVNLGAPAAPHLIDRITDTSPSKVGESFQYMIGDVALALLYDIYEPEAWPFPDEPHKIPEKYGDFRDYVDFINSDGAREQLQASWRRYINDPYTNDPRRDRSQVPGGF